LSIVESFEYTDHSLMSAIGTQDGKIYDNLLNWARNYNDVNKHETKIELRKDTLKLYSEMRTIMKEKANL